MLTHRSSHWPNFIASNEGRSGKCGEQPVRRPIQICSRENGMRLFTFSVAQLCNSRLRFCSCVQHPSNKSGPTSQIREGMVRIARQMLVIGVGLTLVSHGTLRAAADPSCDVNSGNADDCEGVSVVDRNYRNYKQQKSASVAPTNTASP
jgi:hypothetical protein